MINHCEVFTCRNLCVSKNMNITRYFYVKIQQNCVHDSIGIREKADSIQRTRNDKAKLLFLDSTACHAHVEFSNTMRAWLSLNTTSITQQMDKRITRCFMCTIISLLRHYSL